MFLHPSVCLATKRDFEADLLPSVFTRNGPRSLVSGALEPPTQQAISRLTRAGWRALWVVGFLLPLCLQALDPAKSIHQFNIQNWSRASGLPADRVNAIAQSKDGFIWLGTLNGLVRFDGAEFLVMSSGISGEPNHDVLNLSAAIDGGVWLTLNNGRVGRYDGRRFLPLEVDPRQQRGLRGYSVLQRTDGSIWVGSSSGLDRWSDKGLPAVISDDSSTGTILSLTQDSQDRVWIGTARRGLFNWSNGKLSHFADESAANSRIMGIAVDDRGHVWTASEDGLRSYDSDGHRKNITKITGEVTAVLVDRNGDVWAGTNGSGVARYQAGKVSYLRKLDGLASDNITSLMEDDEGSIWIGTSNGLSQITDLKFPFINERDGLPAGGTRSVWPAKTGGVWVSTNSGFARVDASGVRNTSDPALFSNPYTKTVFESRNGLLYASGGDKSISVISADRRVAHLLNNDWPEAFAEDSEGVIVGIGPTLCRIKEGVAIPFSYKGPVPALDWIINLCVAADGAIWVAGANGVFRVQDGRFQHWSTADGLSSLMVESILEDIDGAIWVASATGIARIKQGQLKTIPDNSGMPDPKTYAMVPDDLGYFWFWTERGICRVSRDSLNACADGRAAKIDVEVFDGIDAVKSIDRTDQNFSACKTSDGRIWLPSPRGVIVIDPAAYTKNVAPPKVSIQEVRQNGRPQDDLGKLSLHVADTLEISFAALSYVSPKKLQVRYRLSGFDTAWVDAGGRRMVSYRNLRPGTYQFEVQAGNGDGVWTTQGARLGFVLRPPFYQTLWFFGIAGATSLVALMAGYRWKVARLRFQQAKLQAQNELLENRIAERTRELAREHELLRALLDNSSDRIYFKDTQSRYLKASQAHAENFGLKSADELVGSDDSRFLSTTQAQATLEEEKTIIKTGIPLIGKIEKEEHATGREEWLLTSKMPYRNPAGEIVGTFGLSKNITAIKEAEKKLNDVHRQLLETSRRAGMSEVATSVLHNVGNVLNSVNVSATLAVEIVRDSKISLVSKISGLLDQHRSDLTAYLTSDPKGQKIPGFLASLSQELQEEQGKVLQELNHLTANIEHIKEIVALQQSFAKVSGVAETALLADMVDDALRMQGDTLQRHGIELVREDALPLHITIERHKLIQILVNLFRNAEQACDESGRADKRIIVSSRKNGDGMRITVSDNGVGIAAENVTRIFSHGFTTRKNGHGFGLHSGALAATELGGTLSVESAGLGKGATFILDLPLTQPSRAESE